MEEPPAQRQPSTRLARDIASQLTGSMPCMRCKYDLRGLSIRAACPECNLPVRATLLYVVDPLAEQFKPLRAPKLTALGMLLWGFAALVCGALTWTLRISDMLAPWSISDRAWAIPILVTVALSGVGSLVFISPLKGLSRSRIVLAAVGSLLHVPLCALLFQLHAVHDQFGGASYGPDVMPDAGRATLRVFILVTIAVTIVCVRPNARMLYERSLLMRTGVQERQTLAAMLAVLGVIACGDAMMLAQTYLPPEARDVARQLAQVVIAAGSLLFLLGLARVAVDCARLYRVLAQAPVSLRSLMRPTPGQTA